MQPDVPEGIRRASGGHPEGIRRVSGGHNLGVWRLTATFNVALPRPIALAPDEPRRFRGERNLWEDAEA